MSDRKTLTKAQQAELAEQLDRQFSTVHLRCDGYLVSAGMTRIGHNRLGIAVYVNGYIRGRWMGQVSHVDELPEEARRFWRPQQKQRFNPKLVRSMEKVLGKRQCKAKGYYDTVIVPVPFWSRPRPFIRHLLQHNESVEIIDRATFEAEMEEKERILAERRDV